MHFARPALLLGSPATRTKMLSKILQFPIFCVGVFAMYWSLQFGGLTYKMKFLKFSGGRTDMFDWASILMDYFRVKLYKKGNRTLYRGVKCMYLCNHRSWCDFFTDAYLVEGRCCILSRWMVFAVFPVGMAFAAVGRYVLFFTRKKIRDKEGFNDWLDANFSASPLPGILVYPEGHRNLKPTPLALRRGMLKYSHSRRVPVQVVITSEKESVISEKEMKVNFGRKLVVGFSEVVNPEEFTDFEAYFEQIQSVWDRVWGEVYSSNPDDLPRLVIENPAGFHPPLARRISLAAVMVSGFALLYLTLLLGWKAVSFVASTLLFT